MPSIQRITPCLWFDHEAEAAAQFYVSIFDNSRITAISRYTEAGFEIHRKPAGSVLVVNFELDGQAFAAMNGGPMFQLNEAMSLQVHCDTQHEIDHFWDKLAAGGDPRAQQCGWLKDRFGLSWQVVPSMLQQWMTDTNTQAVERTMVALLSMKKPDIAALRRAHSG